MKYFPFRRNRIESSLFMETVRNRISANGCGWAAVEERETGIVVGFAGIDNFIDDAPFAPAVEIGWRFLPEHWGNGYATEAAKAWLEFGFNQLDLPEIVAFAVPENTGSLAVMKRIGMHHRPEFDFNHPAVGDDHPHLRHHIT